MTTRFPRPEILDRIPQGCHAVIEASAGTGKTHTLNVLIEFLNSLTIGVRACASTGKAATYLLHGVTAHSLFGIPPR